MDFLGLIGCAGGRANFHGTATRQSALRQFFSDFCAWLLPVGIGDGVCSDSFQRRRSSHTRWLLPDMVDCSRQELPSRSLSLRDGGAGLRLLAGVRAPVPARDCHGERLRLQVLFEYCNNSSRPLAGQILDGQVWQG